MAEQNKPQQKYEYVEANVKLSAKETVNFTIGDFGYNFVYYWISSYLTIYLTDTIGIAAGAVSALMLVMRIFDAVNDPFIGSLADRTKTKWGRYRPWILAGGIALGVTVALMFCMNPNWSNMTKLIYMWVLYLLVTVASTCTNMPFGAMSGVISSNAGERVKISGIRMVFANFGLQGAGIIAVPLAGLFGGLTVGGYRGAVIICCAIGTPFLIWCATHSKERLQPPPTQDKIPMKKQFSTLGNRLIIICIICNFMTGIVMYGKMSLLTYYFAYVCGDAGIMTIYSVLNLIGAVLGAGVGCNFFYKLLKNKGRVGMLINIVTCVGCTIMYFFLAPSPVWLGLNLIVAFFAGVSGALGYSMTPDAIDVAEYQTGVRCDGFLASFVSTALKIGGAIGPALGLAVLGALGYVANAQQTPLVLNSMNAMVTLVPAACAFIEVIAYAFYNLDDDKHAKIRDELASRRKNSPEE